MQAWGFHAGSAPSVCSGGGPGPKAIMGGCSAGLPQEAAGAKGKRSAKAAAAAASGTAAAKTFACAYCPWRGVDGWCLRRHLNTHIKPFSCPFCEYKAARSERLNTHVLKVHGKHLCNKCHFAGEDSIALERHVKENQ